jgi:hypothetical protein
MVALASTLLLICINMILREPTLRQVSLAGLVCGFIVLSKYSGLALIPVVCVSLITASWIHGLRLPEIAIRFLTLGLSTSLVIAPCFIRNYLVFDSDILGTHTMRKTWSEVYKRSTETQNLWQVLKQKIWWQQLFTSFWAVFGYQSRYVPTVFYGGFLAFIVATVAGGISKISHEFRDHADKCSFRLPLEQRSQFKRIAAWLSVILSVLFNFLGLIYAAVQNLGGPQGRYLFASEIPIMLIIMGGLWSLSNRWGRWFIGAFVAWNAITLVYSFVMMYNMFGFRLKPF